VEESFEEKMNTKGNYPFSSTLENRVTDDNFSLVLAVRTINCTIDPSLIKLALLGVSLALSVHAYSKSDLLFLMGTLERKQELFLESYQSPQHQLLAPEVQDLIADIQSLIDAGKGSKIELKARKNGTAK